MTTAQKEKLPRREQITLRLPEELYAELKREAEERCMPINDLILIIIHQCDKSNLY